MRAARHSSRARLAAAALLAAGAALASLAPPAAAAPPAPADLTVAGGEESWHPVNRFRLSWTNPEPSGAPLAAVRYRVLDPSGAVAVPETRIGWPTDRIDDLTVPAVPGAYAAEVWLEDSTGAEGPRASAKLRFDDQPPGPAEPLPEPAWLGRAAFPHAIRIGHPDGPAPLSGIRGYAVAVDADPDGEPCGGPRLCADAEIDLAGGIADDSLLVPELPEGTVYVHAVAVSGAGVRSESTGHAALRVDKTDPSTLLSGTPPGWTNGPVSLTARASDAASGMSTGEGVGPFTAIRIDGGAPVLAPGPEVGATVMAEGVHTIAYYARDAAGNVNDGGASNGVPHNEPARAVVRVDRSPPRVRFASAQDPSDPELIRVRVADALSGPDPSIGRISVRRAGSGDPFAPLPGAPAGPDELRARWDSGAHPPGRYEFRAVAYDAAGNAAATTRRADGAAMLLPSPLKAATTLRAGFAGRAPASRRCARRGRARRRCRREAVRGFAARPRRLLVPYGRAIRFGGLLTEGVRSPLAGRRVRIVERFAAGAASPRRVRTVRTGPRGRFSVRLAPGPSRVVEAEFAGSRTLAGSNASPVRLDVRSPVLLRVSAPVAKVGGRPLVFTGRVLAPPRDIPPTGKSVQLQFKVAGEPWSEFRTVRTDRRGRFRYAYRFSDDDSRGARFAFRAYAPPRGGWPFEPAASRPVYIVGR